MKNFISNPKLFERLENVDLGENFMNSGIIQDLKNRHVSRPPLNGEINVNRFKEHKI